MDLQTSLYICKMKKILLSFLFITIFLIQSCDQTVKLTANQIVVNSMKAHGSDLLNQSRMDFVFRGLNYRATRDNGAFEYARRRVNDSSTVIDMLSNDHKKRLINNVQQELSDSLLTLYASSVNSVIYFGQLPYSLDGKAVYKELIGEKTINGNDYHKIKVTFDENGGGEDYDDVFIYWINKQSFLIDYLAYSYCEKDCGYRFRESVNRRTINGVIVQDYKNYKETTPNPDLTQMDTFFINGELKLLSEINMEKVSVVVNQ